MGIYSARAPRATRKRRGTRTGKPKSKAKAEEPKKKKRRPAVKPRKAVKKASVKKRAAVKKAAPPKKRAVKKTAPKKRALKKKIATPKKRAAVKKIAAPKKRAAVKKVVPKKRAVKKTALPKKRAAKKVPTTKKRAVKKTAPKKRSTAKKALVPKKRVIRKKVASLAEDQQSARGKPKTSPVRKKLKAEQKKIEKERVDRSLINQRLPRGTGSEKEQSRDSNWRRMRKRFRELLDYARNTEQLPGRRRPRGFYSNKYSTGEERIVRVDRLLTEGSVEEIIYRVNRTGTWMPGVYGIWYGEIAITALGEHLVGSRPRLLEMPGDPDAMFFQTEGYDNTGIWNSYDEMIERLRALLEDLARSPRTVVHLHTVRLLNFDRTRQS